MKYRVEVLSEEYFNAYTDFLLKNDTSLLYASLKFKFILEKLLESNGEYFLVFDTTNSLVGSLPLMIKYNEKKGNIANSLPYYGSNGGIQILHSLASHEKTNVRKILLDTVQNYISEKHCAAYTMIVSPFEEDIAWYNKNYDYDFCDKRIGQITPLPDSSKNIDEALFSLFQSPRPRNIRKAIKSHAKCGIDNSEAAINFLYQTHKDNIISIGGIPKSEKFFKLIPDIFDGQDYHIYIAEKDNVRIAGLLLFYFNKTVEYYTPAIVDDYRSLQPLSLLIFEAMKDAVRNGFQYWNWGGTWLSQKGVYEFKKRWGTVDYPYYYFTKIYNQDVLNYSKEVLLREYPNFFVVPFDKLKS